MKNKKNTIRRIIVTIVCIILIPVYLIGMYFMAAAAVTVGFGAVCHGPSVKENKQEITKYVENYLTNKYGNHNFKVTNVKYEFEMTSICDFSSPEGYWVDFKAKDIDDGWVTIDGIYPDINVKSDSITLYYHFSDDSKDLGIDWDARYNTKPQEKYDEMVLGWLKEDFEPQVFNVESSIVEYIPDDFGRIPTLEELETDTSLFRALSFKYEIPYLITDKEEYEVKLRKFVRERFNANGKFYYHEFENPITIIDVFLEY